MLNNVFLQLAFVLLLSCFYGFLIFRLKLPLIASYLLAGVTVAALGFLNIVDSGLFKFLPNIGIAFVMFLIGMELDLREVRSLGKPIIITALAQIIISGVAGYAIAGSLGFPLKEGIFIGLGLCFSSTVVVIKLLLEKRDLASLYGKLSIGILLVEDIVAIIALMVLSLGSSYFGLGLQQNLPLITLILKAAGFFALTFILSRYVLERVFAAVAKSVELLFLTALTWCFLFTSLAVLSGFSVVIGAFLAGISLASSPYHFQIQGKIKPLRDFFVTLFFIYLGAQVRLTDVISIWPALLILTAFAIFIKPVIFLLVLGVFGFRRHTLFQTALNLSQISEFSLIILLLGVSTGAVRPVALSLMALVGVLSIIISSIMITYSKKIYVFVGPVLHFFEHSSKTHFLEIKDDEQFADHVVVIGAHRVGGPVVRFLNREKIPFVVLDFNPHVIEELYQRRVRSIYGDVGDPDVLDFLNLEKALLIVSTATGMDDNEILIEECKRRKVKARLIVRAIDADHAKALEALGADYVILPEQVSGEYLVSQIKNHWLK